MLFLLAGSGAISGEERHPALGVALDLPPRYEAIPVPPDEPWVVLRYVQERKRDAPRSAVQPKLQLLRIDFRADPEPAVEPAPITTFRRFVEQRLQGWRVAGESEGRAREGWTVKEYELGPDGSSLAELAGKLSQWACELRSPERTWVLLGSCAKDEADRQIGVWRRCAESLELFEPVQPPAVARWTRFYLKNPQFRNGELRTRIRTSLVEGWEAEDTENFLIVYDTSNGSLIQHLKKRLEGIRRAYVELFPAVAEITAVSVVRVCKDREEYVHYGGAPTSAGYWNSAAGELVLFDFDNGQEGKEDARIVLLHEAFHQYIHYAVGELDPHSWFNEGYGDYFSGADFNDYGKVGRIDVNPWRIQWIQQAIYRGEHAPWGTMIRMEKPDFYDARRSIHYAMGWSMIYFLNKSKAVKKNPTWSRILPTYFETLKSASVRERARLEAEGLSEDEPAAAKAAATAREEAVAAAFREVDLVAIEGAWREFTLALKPPK